MYTQKIVNKQTNKERREEKKIHTQTTPKKKHVRVLHNTAPTIKLSKQQFFYDAALERAQRNQLLYRSLDMNNNDTKMLIFPFI